MSANEDAPKVFISYSWTSSHHQEWVERLAQRLVADHVHVVIDIWDLREGQDKYAFMEQMVTDPSIKRVLIILDKRYAEKADECKGGVGTESQIISAGLYQQVEQTKFVPIVAEKDEQGQPYQPVYLKGRIYVDLCSSEGESDEYEKLLRNIYERPAKQRPALGPRPEFLDAPNPASPVTKFRLETFIKAMEQGQPQACGHLKRFLGECVKSLHAFDIGAAPSGELDEHIVNCIREMKPVRDQLVQAFQTICTYSDDPRFYTEVHRFFEA
ncbi:MAG TPA: SEFIR domain-containing protein, partial [Tepidisphaeraceae bacterium]|nr:SEFIR domain-containing protein [Tepidisphaeraceae bacterium]